MRKVLLPVVVLVLALSTFATANELINGSWELGNDSFWARSGGEIVDLTTWFANPGPAPGETDVYGYGIASCWGISEGSILQEVYCDSGVYNVFVSGWLQAKDGGVNPSWIELRLLIDDQLVATERVEVTGGDTGWVQKTINWTGPITTKKTVQIAGQGNAWGGPGEWPWGIVYADGIVMTQELVPEPSSLMALVSGLGTLAGIAFRRRK